MKQTNPPNTEFVIEGKCKNCGRCCSNIPMNVTKPLEGTFLNTDINDEVEHLIATLIKDNPHLDFSGVNKIVTETFGGVLRVELHGLNCHALVKKGNKFFCSIYDKRPPLCKKYPQPKSIILSGCGFKKVTL